MQVPVNQNIDEFKDDFYKGLTMRQTVFSALTVIVGVGVFMLFFSILHLPQALSLYLTLPIVFPIAAYGFLNVHGMNIAEYLKKRRKVLSHSSYSFIPQMLLIREGGDAIDNDLLMEKSDGRRSPQHGVKTSNRILLETEESISDILGESLKRSGEGSKGVSDT